MLTSCSELSFLVMQRRQSYTASIPRSWKRMMEVRPTRRSSFKMILLSGLIRSWQCQKIDGERITGSFQSNSLGKVMINHCSQKVNWSDRIASLDCWSMGILLHLTRYSPGNIPGVIILQILIFIIVQHLCIVFSGRKSRQTLHTSLLLPTCLFTLLFI
jgi:hypothetical protein